MKMTVEVILEIQVNTGTRNEVVVAEERISRNQYGKYLA